MNKLTVADLRYKFNLVFPRADSEALVYLAATVGDIITYLEESEEANMKDLIEGTIVHYVMDDGSSKGEHRAAVIVKVWRDEPKPYVNLLVFEDGSNDTGCAPLGNGLSNDRIPPLWKTSRYYSEEKAPGTWHWIEQD